MDLKERPKESVHIRIDCELYKSLEGMRKRPHSDFLTPRSTVYEEVLFYGEKVQKIRSELGDKEFERVWNLLNKLNLSKVNLEKII